MHILSLVKTLQRLLLRCLFCFRLHRSRGPRKDRKEATGRPDASPRCCVIFRRRCFRGGTERELETPLRLQLPSNSCFCSSSPLLPLLLLLLHQNHFSFSSHPEVNNPDSTRTAYVYFLRTCWVFPRCHAHRAAAGKRYLARPGAQF